MRTAANSRRDPAGRRDSAAAAPVVIFVHIPKAGGTTLSEWLFGQLQSGPPGSSAHRMSFRGVYYYPGGFIVPLAPEAADEAGAAMRQPGLTSVLGHVAFGVHEDVPGASEYLTMLRDPVDRIVSLYNFQRVVESKDRTRAGVPSHESMTLADFVENPPYAEIDNGMCRRIAGVAPAIGDCDERLLERAKGNLRDRFAFAGLMERFDESLVAMTRRFGWSRERPYYPRNVVSAFRPVEPPTGSTLDAIRRRNEYDIELYRYAAALFDGALDSLGAGFEADLERYRAAQRRVFEQVDRRWLPPGLRRGGHGAGT